MKPQCFYNLISNGVNRAKGSHRLLEYHGNVFTPNAADFRSIFRQAGQVDIFYTRFCSEIKMYFPSDDFPRRRNHSQNGPRRHALAAAAFPNQPKCLTFVYI